MFLPPGPDLAWRGNYVSLPAATLKAPIEGNRTVPVEISWQRDGVAPSYSVVFNAREQRVTPLSQIAAVHISNIHSSVPVRLLFPDTGFEIELGPALEGYYPVVTNGLEFTAYVPLIPSGTDGVSIQVLNFLPPPLVFGSTPGGTGVAGVSHIDTAAPLTGGPITATGTVSLQTPLAIQYGGTGQATPDLALDALAETGGTTSGLLARNSAGNWVMQPLSAGGTPALPMSILNGGTGATTGFLGLDNLTAAGSQTGQLARAANGSWVLSPAGAGTITGVTPGAGIAGGGTSGNVAVALASYVEGYNHAQHVMTGGGNITWGGIGGRLGWSAAFMCMPISSATTPSNNLTIDQPTSGTIPAGNTYDGVARTWTAAGIVLTAWEALYVVHTLGGVQNALTYWVAAYSGTSPIASNWILIATVNGTGGALKLGTGEFIQPGKTIISGDQYVSKNAGTALTPLTVYDPATLAVGIGGQLNLSGVSLGGVAHYAAIAGYAIDGSAGTEMGSLIFKTILNGVLSEKARLTFNGLLAIGDFAFGGSGSPGLKANGTTLQVRLADDSNFAPLAALSITLSADPTAPLQAATKQYVDARSGFTQAVADPLYVNVSGDAMTAGDLTLFRDPTQPLHAATKQYADSKLTQAAADARYVDVAGDTMTGALTFNGAAGSYRVIQGQTNGSQRWALLLGNTTAESGGNAGSDFGLTAYNDAGSPISTPLTISRSTGNATFGGAVNVNASGSYPMTITAPNDGSYSRVRTAITGNRTWAFGASPDGTYVIADETALAQRFVIKQDGVCLNTTGSWGTISDASVKSNIQPYSRGLEAILALEPVAYVYNENAPFGGADGMVRYGLVADQVQPHIPEAVGTYEHRPDPEKDETITLSTLDPGSLTYVLINAIKELKLEIDGLNAVIGALSRAQYQESNRG